MNEADLIRHLILPARLGLLGFVEPCSMGTNLLIAKYVEGKDRQAALSIRLPKWTGAVFLLLGAWSIYFGLFVNLVDWA